MSAHWGAHERGLSLDIDGLDDNVAEGRDDAARIQLAARRLLGREEADS